MDDRTMMDNLLTVTKNACDLMMHGSIESPTPDVHIAFSKTLNDSLSLQSQIYAHMAEKGWYSVPQVEQQKVQQLRQQFK
ncbi:MAG: spore coat protein [Ruminococcaceae bacterium]|nr:spore coat protein [Oscillospiraceae bacterium]